jgi:hypothetical protein
VGATPLLGSGVYVPQLSLANFSAQPAHVTVQLAQTSGGASNSYQVQSLTIPAGQTEETTLENLEGDPGLRNSFIVQSDLAPGDVLANLIFESSQRVGEVEVLAKDQLDQNNVGTEPWSTEDGTASTLLIFNNSTIPQTFQVHLSGSGIAWHKNYILQSTETQQINIGDLIATKTPDDSGKILPLNTTSGTVIWIMAHHGAGKGRVLQSNANTGMARSFSCNEYGTVAGAEWQSNSTSVPEGQTVDVGEVVAEIDLVVGEGCSGTFEDYGNGEGYLFSYSSSNTSVAEVTDPTGEVADVDGISEGSATIYGSVEDPEYDCEGFAEGAESVTPGISQLPPMLNMSSGDTDQTIDFSITPDTVPLTVAFATGMLSNPNSSSAATVDIPTIVNAVGDESAPITVIGSNSPSGLFYAVACATGGAPCAPIGTDIKIPPQILIQMMQSEAGGTNTTAMGAVGDVVRNRFGSAFFNPPYSTYQNTIVSGQFTFTGTSNGIEPELDQAVSVFTRSGGDFCGALAFWTPTHSQWTAVQSAINSGTTTFPSGSGAPVYSSWPASQQQILNVTSVGNQSNGAPNFLFLVLRGPTQAAAVTVSCSP